MALKERVEAAGSVVILKVTEQPGDTTAQTRLKYSTMQQAVEVLTENGMERPGRHGPRHGDDFKRGDADRAIQGDRGGLV